jgi:hypothetical protein
MYCVYMSCCPEVKTYCTDTPEHYRAPVIRTVCNPEKDECPPGWTCEARSFTAGAFLDEDVGLYTCENPPCPATHQCLLPSDCATAGGVETNRYSCESSVYACCEI